MRKFSKIFALILTVCLITGIIAVTASATAYSVSPDNQLVIPTVREDVTNADGSTTSKLVSGNYAYSDGTTTSGWAQGNGGSATYTSWDTSAGYIAFRQNLAKKTPGHKNAPYIEWNLSDGHYDTANMYTMNMRDYGYAVVDFDYGTDRNRMQIGYHVYYYDTSNCYIEPMYKTYSEAMTDEEIQDIIDANYKSLVDDIALYQGKGLLAGVDAADYKWSVEEAIATETLAFCDGSHAYLVLRSMKSLTYETYVAGNRADAYVDVYTHMDENGDWWLCNDKTLASSTARVKVDGINDFKHITFVAKTTSDTSTTKGSFRFSVYIDGVFFSTKLLESSNYVALFLDALRQDIPVSAKCADSYSIVFDNMTVNYYEPGYNSGSDLGVDDLFDGKTANKEIALYNLVDTVYNPSYTSIKGAVTINGVSYNVPTLAKAAIASLRSSAIITSGMYLNDIDVDESVEELIIVTDKEITVSAKTASTHIVEDGEGCYIIRKPAESEIVTLNWLDLNGNVLKSETLLFDVMPEVDESLGLGYVNSVTGKLYDAIVDEWNLEIDGELTPLRAFDYSETEMYDVINVIPSATVVEKEIVYYIGIFDEVTRTVKLSLDSNGTYNAYADASTMKAQIEAAASGSTLVLLSDVQTTPNDTFAIKEGKEMSLDLNGFDFMRVEGARSQGVATFELYDGATFNVYSSRPGGRIFDARAYRGTASTGTLNGESTTVYANNMAYASAGFIRIKETADAATVNIGAFRGYEANLEYNGGTLVYVNGVDYGTVDPKDTATRHEYLGGGVRTINVNGGEYYLMARAAYGMFSVTGPDVTFNVKDAKFYSSYSTYSIFHDYGTSNGTNSTTKWPRFTVNTTYNISNCEFLCRNVDTISKNSYTLSNGVLTQGAPFAGSAYSEGKFFYEIAEASKAYIDNCVIIGKLYHNLNGNIYLGEGNVISTSISLGSVKYRDGVKAIIPNSTADSVVDVTLSYSHPHIYNDYDEFLVLKAGETNYYLMKEGVFDIPDVTVTYSANVSLVTTSATSISEKVKDYVASAEWYDPDGNLYSTTYGILGGTIEPADATIFGVKQLDNGWFDVGYAAWYNVNTGANKDYTLAAASNKFTPIAGLVGDIEGAQIRLDLAHTEFTYFLYIPKSNTPENIDFALRGDADKHIGFFNAEKVTDKSTIYSDASYLKEETISVDGESVSCYRWHFMFAADQYNYLYKSMRFIVKEYDLNGNGVIEDDETNIPLTYTFKTSVVDYARAVVDIYKHGDDASTLMYEMVRFMDSITTYVNGGTPIAEAQDKYDVFYDEYDALCDCSEADAVTGRKNCKHIVDLDKLVSELPEDLSEEELKDYVVLKNTDTDQSDLIGTVHSVSFGLSASKPRLDMYLMPIDGTYTVSVKYNVYNDKGEYVVAGTSISKQKNKDVVIGEETVSLLTYRVIGISMAYMASELTVTITADYNDPAVADKTVTGTYSLATYIMRNNEVEVSKALYAFSLAAFDYKTITAEEREAENK